MTEHRPWPLPRSPWAMTQQWNDLLFAHWPVQVADIAGHLPQGLAVDTFDGYAWLGVVPFWMDGIRFRGLPPIPGTSRFPELNLRTYVRERNSNLAGVYFYSLDAANPLAVSVARAFFKLPYYWARMGVRHQEGGIRYSSKRLLVKEPARFEAKYRSLGREAARGDLEHFLTERYCLYTSDARGLLYRGNIHHLPWPLEEAEAEIGLNELPDAFGLRLPEREPILHYSRTLKVYVWPLEQVSAMAKHTAAQVLPAAETL
ncbi:MAG: DUF2071 domain-containing protein [Acidobacteria bacterium]|nr:DUF2071 domain-containing protein [Acidobacteriota bacterium]